MINTGIYRLEDLKDLKSLRALWGGRHLPSITLYEEASKLERGDVLAEEILRAFSDGSSTFKRTYTNRFEAFDKKAMEFISDIFPSATVMKVHDAGVSDGRTACDFFELMRTSFSDLEYYASDLRNKFFVAEDKGSKAVFDSNGTLLELVVPPFVYNIHKPEHFFLYPINYIHRAVAMSRVVPLLRANLHSGKNIKTLLLVCARARELATSDPRFHLVQYDLLQPMKNLGKFTLVRAMNVLNRSYFSERQMRTIVSHITASMEDGALFLAGSNQERGSPVKGAIYRKVDGNFSLLWTSAEGLPDVHRAVTAHNSGRVLDREHA